jgi:hypothetical protein
VTPTEAISTWFNRERIEQRQYRPLFHLFGQPLTAEGVPALIPLLDDPNPVIRQGVAGLLQRVDDELSHEELLATSWRQWDGSRHTALAALRSARPRIRAIASETTEEADPVYRLERLASRCASSVAKPIVCEPLPAGWGQRPRTPLEQTRLRPHRAADAARVK